MDLLTPGVGLVFWQTIIFVLLVLLLAKFAWKPILNSLREREKFIQESLNSAEKAKQKMEAIKADNEKFLEEAREERDNILREAREAVGRLHNQAQLESKKKADRIIEDAIALINTEKQVALRDVRTQVAMLSLEIAEKLMRQNLSEDSTQKELINRFIKELKSN